MEKMVMHYPGDPPVEVCLVNRAEFFRFCPPEGRLVKVGPIDGPADVVQELGTNIYCDLCSDDPKDEIYLLFSRLGHPSRAYCCQCFEHLRPYCKAKPHSK